MEMLTNSLLTDFYVLFLGMCIGSFLNVCIYRIPNDLSIISPPSTCPKCETGIKWYDNIPLISYLILGGRCRKCKTRISLRYPMVEVLTGLFAWLALLQFGFSFSALIYFLFIALLLTVTFIDIDHGIIPDIISLPGILLGLAASFALPQVDWIDSLIGIIAGGGSLWIVIKVYYIMTGKLGMGGGDVKLLAMIGAFLGWKAIPFTIMTSSLVGTLVGVILMLKAGKGMKMRIPFGPFLAIGAILYIFLGPPIIHWYFNVL